MSDKSLHHRYIPGLDGLRAFAVLAVIAYHLNFNWADGGFIGVDIFFCFIGVFNYIYYIACPRQCHHP
ncbi:hypothetical protein ACNSPU_03370 [Bacillus velezensis]